MAAGCQDLCFSVPAQSLGADVLIVHTGEDVGDDGALLLSPLNHGGACSTVVQT